MKTAFKKIFLLIAVVMTAMVCFVFDTSAITYNGIANNGTNGIINICKLGLIFAS